MKKFESLFGVIIILILWQVIALLKIINPIFLPSPIDVLNKLIKNIFTGSLTFDIAYTLYRLIIGYLIGIIVGVPLGLIIGTYKRLYKWFEFLIDFFRSIPVTSLFPLFLFFFGVGDEVKYAIVAYAVALINLFNSMYGVINSSKTRLLVAKVFGANRRQQFLTVIIPEALPQIIVGLRLSLSSALVYVIVTEMFLGSTSGLGYRIYNANLTYEIPDMYGSIIIAGILGYFVNQFILYFEKKYSKANTN